MELKPRRRHRATGRPRGGRRPGAGRKRSASSSVIEEVARRKGVSVRTVQRFLRVTRYSPTLAKEVKGGYREALEAGRWRVPLSWWGADRLVRSILTELRDGRSVEEIVTAHHSSPKGAALFETIARERSRSAPHGSQRRERP